MYGIAAVLPLLEDVVYRIKGNQNIRIANARTVADADEHSVVWISARNAQRTGELISETAATLIVCPEMVELDDGLLGKKCVILCDNPKLVFSLIVAGLFAPKPAYGVHPTAAVHEEAQIDAETYIGPFSYVGHSHIAAGTIIWGHCYIHDNVTIGKNVEIHTGCILGDDGSGYAKNDAGEWIKFPHIGGLILEDNVEVGANTYINKGALGNTHIKRGAKIGNSVCIGHNVVVEENSIVIANSLVAGSSHVGKNVYIAPSVTIRNALTIGDNATVGMGAVVLKDVPANTTVLGNPAESMEDFRKWARLKRKLFEMFGGIEKKK